MTTPSESLYREIPLTKGKVAIVDAADYDWLMQYKWCASKMGKCFYAIRNRPRSLGHPRQISMHREILGLEPGDPRLGDHKKTDETLNNTHQNLRIVTPLQSSHNRGVYSHNSIGLKGVGYEPKNKKFHARITINGKQTWLGYYSTPEQAHAAYCEAARKHFGEYACFG